MSRKIRITKKQQREIAGRRIGKLFTMAEENALSGKLDLTNRYVELARKISMRNLTPIKKEYKRRFCKHCYSYLLPTVTCRTRINRGKLVVYCHNCKKYTRIPLKNNGKKPSARLK
jgi:ribonuclease P protein subunit RPR2